MDMTQNWLELGVDRAEGDGKELRDSYLSSKVGAAPSLVSHDRVTVVQSQDARKPTNVP